MAWLYAPSERRALGDVAKLAAALRSGAIDGRFLDGGGADVTLGTVGRVTLLAPADLGLPSSERRFVLGRGTDALCLAEVIAGDADREVAERLLAAVESLRAREPGRKVVGWLVAARVAVDAAALLASAGAAATSTMKVT